MAERKKPKFKIGDQVVITIYGTVGKITDIKWMDGIYVYEVNHSEGLYMESSLELLEDYDGEIMEEEQIKIEYRFFIGDLVQVKGYGSDLFKVIGFRTEIWRYKEDAWEDVIYELARVFDGEWLEARDEELILVADSQNADLFLKKLGAFYGMKKKGKQTSQQLGMNRQRQEELRRLKEKAAKKALIDSYLDLYNDYSFLFNWFGDDKYKQMMDIILIKLKQIVNNGD